MKAVERWQTNKQTHKQTNTQTYILSKNWGNLFLTAKFFIFYFYYSNSLNVKKAVSKKCFEISNQAPFLQGRSSYLRQTILFFVSLTANVPLLKSYFPWYPFSNRMPKNVFLFSSILLGKMRSNYEILTSLTRTIQTSFRFGS